MLKGRMIPMVAVASVAVLAAWWLARAPQPAHVEEPRVEATPPAPATPAIPPTPIVPPLRRMPVAPRSASAQGNEAPPPASPEPAPGADNDPQASPFARLALSHHIDALQLASTLVRQEKIDAAAQLLVARADTAQATDHDRLVLTAARLLLDHGHPDRAGKLLDATRFRDPALDGEVDALRARVHRPVRQGAADAP